MDDLLDDLTQIPLSGTDLIDISAALGSNKERLGWITYDSLANVNSIDELFKGGDIDAVFILIQPPNEMIGHWITLGNNQEGLFYYDPYGLSIEEDIEITKANDRLLQLLMGHMIDVSAFKHQKFGTDMGKEINTCGRHDAVRAFFFWMTNKEYNDKIIAPPVARKQVDGPDTIVNLLTAFLSKSDDVVEKFLMGN